jgi:hypothetical protein
MCCAFARVASSNPMHLQLHNPLLYLPILLAGQPYLSARASSALPSFPALMGGSSSWPCGYGASLRLSYPVPWSPSSVGHAAAIGLVSTTLYGSECIDAQSALRHVRLGIELDCSPFVFSFAFPLGVRAILGQELIACLTLLLAMPPPTSNTECCRWLAVAAVTPARARPHRPPCRLDNGPSSFALTPRARRHRHRPQSCTLLVGMPPPSTAARHCWR